MNTEVFDLGKIGITLGGEYDNKVIYEKLTIVLYKGKSYISTKTTQGVSPEENILVWQLVAEAKDAYHMLVDAGKTTLSEEEFLEQLVDATKGRFIVQGNITNAADEEDLTVEHSDLLGIDTLKLANRDNTNGMGYVILRKNKSFAEQVTKENTIYEIRYNFNLENNITIPANCILKFNGGSISGKYTITGSNTCIDAKLTKIFNTDVILSGIWNISEAYPEWFGANGNGITDDRAPIQKCIDSFQKIKFSKPVYLISSYTDPINKVCIVIPMKKILEGNALYQYTMTTIKAADNFECNSILGLNGNCICIKYLGIFGGNPSDRTHQLTENGIKSYDETQWNAYLTLDHVFIDSCVNGFNVLTFMCDVLSCRVDRANGTAFKFGGSETKGRGTSVNMQKCGSYDCYGTIYDLSYLSYSTFLCCSADRAGYDPNNLIAENINSVFNFYDSRSLTFISCACEYAYKVVNSASSFNFLFVNCIFVTKSLNNIYTYHIEASNFLKFENTQLVSLENNDSEIFVNFTNQDLGATFYNIIFSSCYYRKNNKNTQFTFDNINANFLHGIEINKISYQEEITDTDILPAHIAQNNYDFKKICIWNCDNNLSIPNGLNLNNIPTLLKFNGNGHYLYSHKPTITHIVNNCEHIEFNNFIIRVGYVSSDVSLLFFLVSNSKVIFRNCTFMLGVTSEGQTWSGDNIFDAENSDIRLINCKIQNPMNKAIVKDPTITKNSTYTIVKSNETQTSIDCEWRNTSGTFANKPINIPIGFKYFCTDKQTAEGATNGIELIHKGNNVWVDALGRVVS